MILVDTSIWIDLLGKSKKYHLENEQLLRVTTCPPVIQEVLQGIRNDLAHRRIQEAFLAFPRVASPVDLDLFLQAADLYRVGRRKGLTIRSTVDCLIASIAIQYRLPVWHNDRDFDQIAKITDLRVLEKFE